MRRLTLALPLLLASTTSFALPPPRQIKIGANHHLGDRSFIAKYGRAPTTHDDERERMHQHLSFVRDWLASRPATKPELATKRAEILAYFDEYIAKNTTPRNTHMPWRTPVFIDDAGTICAVGYLIERSVGRALPEQIAKRHRYELIEDIANKMPEVQAWVAESGFSLEEIGSIQPAYEEPSANTWRTWDLAKHAPAEGPYNKNGTTGTFHKRRMEGSWTVASEDGKIVGKGMLKHGAGTWTSFYPDGKRMAEGPYADNRANGAWKIFYRSGNLAAEGSFEHGDRAGRWHFYYDTQAQTPIAIGSFSGRAVSGTWKHYDDKGKLIATTRSATPDQWPDHDWGVDGGEGFLLDIASGPGEIKQLVHQGTVGSQHQELDTLSLGAERIYIHSAFGPDVIYDADGFKLDRQGTAWLASDCHWTATRKEIAHAGDVVRLHGLLYNAARKRAHVSGRDMDYGNGDDGGLLAPSCGRPQPVTGARVARLDALLAAEERVRSLTPNDVRQAVIAQSDEAAASEDAAPTDDDASTKPEKPDAALLAAHMGMYLEWPHIDGKFVELYATMAGRITWNWTDGDPERDASPAEVTNTPATAQLTAR